MVEEEIVTCNIGSTSNQMVTLFKQKKHFREGKKLTNKHLQLLSVATCRAVVCLCFSDWRSRFPQSSILLNAGAHGCSTVLHFHSSVHAVLFPSQLGVAEASRLDLWGSAGNFETWAALFEVAKWIRIYCDSLMLIDPQILVTLWAVGGFLQQRLQFVLLTSTSSPTDNFPLWNSSKPEL